MKKKDLQVGDYVEQYNFGGDEISWFEYTQYRIIRWWSEFKYFFKKLYHIVKYGFPLEESWDFYSGCIKYSLPRLKHFRQHLTGFPHSLSEEEWNLILDKIIWSMEHAEDHIAPIYPENYDHRQIVVKHTKYGVAYKSADDRPIDYSPAEKHEKSVQEGFELFGKWFKHLWD